MGNTVDNKVCRLDDVGCLNGIWIVRVQLVTEETRDDEGMCATS